MQTDIVLLLSHSLTSNNCCVVRHRSGSPPSAIWALYKSTLLEHPSCISPHSCREYSGV